MVIINLPSKLVDFSDITNCNLRKTSGNLSDYDLAGDDEPPGASAKGSGGGLELLSKITAEPAMMTAAEIDEARDDPNCIPLFDMPFVLPGGLPGATPFSAGARTTSDGTMASWGIDAVGATDVPADAGAGIVVAVLDSGIRKTHKAFNGVTVEGKNFTGGDPSDITDKTGHGTHTTGTILGRDVDGVRIGIARGVERVMVGKILEEGVTCTTNMIVQAIFWALGGGASIINMSLGIDFPGYVAKLIEDGRNSQDATSIALTGYRENIRAFDGLSNSLSSGMPGFFRGLLVAAAGNESRRPDYAITTSPPASGQGFFAVAAVDRQLTVWPESNQDANIAGPGVDIVSASHEDNSKLVSMTGTSMASPHVGGVGVLYSAALKKTSSFGQTMLRRRLEMSALALPGQSARDVGVGLVHWSQA